MQARTSCMRGINFDIYMKHLEEVTALCVQCGASETQAPILAKQLLKRTGQLAEERGIKEVEAMNYLLQLMVSAQDGGGSSHPSCQAE